jgi:hypothetical protein
MAGVISTGNLPRTLQEGVRSIFDNQYNRKEMQFLKFMEKTNSKKNFEIDVQVDSFGLAPVKNQGSNLEYDSIAQGITPTYTNVTYSKGFIVTMEEYEDELYDLFSKQARMLADSFKLTKETVCANVLNNGFNSSYTMTAGDGKELFSALHPRGPNDSGTYSNKLAVPSALSEAALEQLLIQIDSATDSRGLRIALQAKRAVVPAALGFEAERIIQSVLQNNTANNAINAIMSTGRLPEGYTVNNYLTSTTNWFVTTDCPDGLKYQERKALTFGQDNDFGTYDYRFKAVERYTAGWTNPRGCYGSGS